MSVLFFLSVRSYYIINRKEMNISFDILDQSVSEIASLQALKEENRKLKHKNAFLERKVVALNKVLVEKCQKIDQAKKNLATLSRNCIKLGRQVLEMGQRVEQWERKRQEQELVRKGAQQQVQKMRGDFERRIDFLNQQVKNKIKDNNILFQKNERHKRKHEENQEKIQKLLSQKNLSAEEANSLSQLKQALKRVSIEKAEVEAKLWEAEGQMRAHLSQSFKYSKVLSKPVRSAFYEDQQ